MKTLRLFLMTFLASLCFGVMYAQSPAGMISGLVVKAGKKPVAGPSVTLLNADDSTPLKTLAAGHDGSFALMSLKAGTYRLAMPESSTSS